MLYNQRITTENNANLSINKQYLELITENISLRNKLNLRVNSDDFDDEKKYIEHSINAYDTKYATIKEAIKIIIFSSVFLVMAVLLLWVLIKIWVIYPVNKLANISNMVATGNLNIRAKGSSSVFKDELDILINTFNNMLDSMQSNLELIKDNSSMLQSLIDSIPDAIRVIDKRYNVILANKTYYNITQNHSKKAHKYNNPHGDKKNLIEDYKPFELINESKDCEYKKIIFWTAPINSHVSINAAPLYINKKLCIVESIRDLQSDINFSHQQKLSSLGFLATSVAHEMKNNLGAAKLILETMLNEDCSEMTSVLYKQIVECTNVPERLLKLAEGKKLEVDNLNCAKNIKEVVKIMDYEAKKIGAVIELNIKKELFIKGNDVDLKMILINLITNSLNAIEHNNGKVIIELKEKTDNVIIIVSDNGKGIRKDAISRIFEPFYSENKKDGNGLGLSIVKSIVSSFNGNIKVKSKLEVGTSFELTFKKIKV